MGIIALHQSKDGSDFREGLGQFAWMSENVFSASVYVTSIVY